MRFITFLCGALFLAFCILSGGCTPLAVQQSVDMIRQANVKIAEEAITPAPEGEDPNVKLGKIHAISEDVEILIGPVQLYIEEPTEFIAYNDDSAEALSKTTQKAVEFRLMIRKWWDGLKDRAPIIGGGVAKASSAWGWLEPVLYSIAGALGLGGAVAAKKKFSNKEPSNQG